MGRKKKKQSKPWCWYCNREFDDEKILIQHQKAKHFKCHICHKRLYTGPGLSIHCLQVHKEAIDKVPNSLPNRCNIEIEIYGMEGIPPEDVKEHEKQKQGKQGRAQSPSSGEDEPVQKKTKSEGLLGNGPTPGIMPGQMMPGQNPQGMQFPGQYAPGQFGPMGHMGPMAPMMGPPFMAPGFSSRMMGPAGHMPGMPGQQPGQPNAQPGGPGKPLFPSAANISTTSSSAPVGADFKPIVTTAQSTTGSIGPVKPTFPAYGDSKENKGDAKETPKVALINTATSTSKIMHPSEDISLEEFRAKLPKYSKTSPVKSEPSISVPAQSPVQSQANENEQRQNAVAAMARFQAARPQMAVSAAGPVPIPVSSASMGLMGQGIMRHAVTLGPPISHAQMLHGGNMNMMRPGPPMGIHPGLIGQAVPQGPTMQQQMQHMQHMQQMQQMQQHMQQPMQPHMQQMAMQQHMPPHMNPYGGGPPMAFPPMIMHPRFR